MQRMKCGILLVTTPLLLTLNFDRASNDFENRHGTWMENQEAAIIGLYLSTPSNNSPTFFPKLPSGKPRADSYRMASGIRPG